MQKEFRIYFQSLIVFSSSIGAVIYFLSKIFISDHIGGYTWVSLVYFIVLTLVFHYGLSKSTFGRPQQFFRYFMTATSLKLALHLIVVIGYSLTFRSNAVNFIVGFFLLYLLFTVFEVRQALRIHRQ